MFKILHLAALIGGAAVMSISVAEQAEARIKCNGAYQVVRGHGEIATPYCEDQYLARVARSYGVRVSASAIRRSVSRKQEICRHIGHDHRISQICHQYRLEGCTSPSRC